MDELLATVVPFVREGVAWREPVLVALPPDRLAAVEAALGEDATRVDFVDMEELGANPACILPEWRRFLEDTGAGPVRGVAEPVWSGRRLVELEEVALHEALLNLAFDHGRAWQLLCPYDVTTMPPHVIEEASRTHPSCRGFGPAGGYDGPGEARRRFTAGLPAAPGAVERLDFGHDDLVGLRGVVTRLAEQARVPAGKMDDLVLAAHELAANSVVHGGGAGVLRSWVDDGALVVEVSDAGVIDDPLVGRDLLLDLAENGRGIWMANQLCDLVQVRSGTGGTVVRIHAWI
jgi:anti-sigma regulatory factor (Ser/Thr protein kinase)